MGAPGMRTCTMYDPRAPIASGATRRCGDATLIAVQRLEKLGGPETGIHGELEDGRGTGNLRGYRLGC